MNTRSDEMMGRNGTGQAGAEACATEYGLDDRDKMEIRLAMAVLNLREAAKELFGDRNPPDWFNDAVVDAYAVINTDRYRTKAGSQLDEDWPTDRGTASRGEIVTKMRARLSLIDSLVHDPEGPRADQAHTEVHELAYELELLLKTNPDSPMIEGNLFAALKELSDRCEFVKAELDKDIPNGEPVHRLSAALTWPLSTAAGAMREYVDFKLSDDQLIAGWDRVTERPRCRGKSTAAKEYTALRASTALQGSGSPSEAETTARRTAEYWKAELVAANLEINRLRASLDTSASRIEPSEIWQHVKSGGLYEWLMSVVNEADQSVMVVYRSLETGVRWVRPSKDFYDGRFVRAALRSLPPEVKS